MERPDTAEVKAEYVQTFPAFPLNAADMRIAVRQDIVWDKCDHADYKRCDCGTR